MPDVINVHEAKTHLPRRQPGLVAGRVTDAFFEPLPADELEGWLQ